MNKLFILISTRTTGLWSFVLTACHIKAAFGPTVPIGTPRHTSTLSRIFINFYELLPQELSCKDLLNAVKIVTFTYLGHGWPHP